VSPRLHVGDQHCPAMNPLISLWPAKIRSAGRLAAIEILFFEKSTVLLDAISVR